MRRCTIPRWKSKQLIITVPLWLLSIYFIIFYCKNPTYWSISNLPSSIPIMQNWAKSQNSTQAYLKYVPASLFYPFNCSEEPQHYLPPLIQLFYFYEDIIESFSILFFFLFHFLIEKDIRRVQMNFFYKTEVKSDVENKQVYQGIRGRGGINCEIGIDIYRLLYIK